MGCFGFSEPKHSKRDFKSRSEIQKRHSDTLGVLGKKANTSEAPTPQPRKSSSFAGWSSVKNSEEASQKTNSWKGPNPPVKIDFNFRALSERRSTQVSSFQFETSPPAQPDTLTSEPIKASSPAACDEAVEVDTIEVDSLPEIPPSSGPIQPSQNVPLRLPRSSSARSNKGPVIQVGVSYSLKLSFANPTTDINAQPASQSPVKAYKSSENVQRNPSPDAATESPGTPSTNPYASSISSRLRNFTYAELRVCTRNFANDRLIGIGGFGKVYRGVMRVDDTEIVTESSTKQPTGSKQRTVAVKKLDTNSLQGHKEWMAEVSLLGSINHSHLVQLIGYCMDGQRRLLVYEFMPNASLDRFLFGVQSPGMPWDTRLKVALGTAKGLAYLHEEVESPVIYRDFKTTNILLDENFTAKLSDFGLAREGPSGEETHVSTQVRGTAGYAAPEYVLTGHLTPKNDVWAFGVVLLEILTGRPCFDAQRPPKEQNLVPFSRPYMQNPKFFLALIDPRLQGTYNPLIAQKAGQIANWCLSMDAHSRPLMSDVVKHLEHLTRTGLDPRARLKVASTQPGN